MIKYFKWLMLLKISISLNTALLIVVSCNPPNNKRIVEEIWNGMVRVGGGDFQMGSELGRNDEAPVHVVNINTFYISKFEVTQEQWQSVMGSNPSKFVDRRLPVEQVNMKDILQFLTKLNSITGRYYRLPSEAEWEFAAKGGQNFAKYKFAGSADIDEVAWYWKNSGDKLLEGEWDSIKLSQNHCRTHAVGTKRANSLGLYDMTGNVWEWCSDWYFMYQDSIELRDSLRGSNTGEYKVLRGGSSHDGETTSSVSFRGSRPPKFRSHIAGIRLAHSTRK